MLPVDSQTLQLGRGKLYVDRLDSNRARTGELLLGNCSAFGITPADQTAKHYSSMDAEGGLLAEVTTQRDYTLDVTGHSFDPEVAALLYMAAAPSAFTQSTATATDAALCASAKLGRLFATGYRNITVTAVKQGATVLVLNTDYTVDASTGRIYLVPTSSTITEGSALTWTGSAAAITSGGGISQVKAGTLSKIELFVRFVGDPAAGPVNEVEVWLCTNKPNGARPFIGNDFGSWQMQMSVLRDDANHPTEPFFRELRTGHV